MTSTTSDYQTVFNNDVQISNIGRTSASKDNASLQTDFLGVSKKAYINELDVTSTSAFGDKATFNNGLEVAGGDAKFIDVEARDIHATRDVTVDGALEVTGVTTLSSDVTITGDLTANTAGKTARFFNVNVSSEINADTVNASSLDVTQNATIHGDLTANTVGKTAKFFDVNVQNNLDVAGTATFNNGLTVTNGSTTLKEVTADSAEITGDLTVGGTLNITGTVNSDNDVTKEITISGNESANAAIITLAAGFSLGAFFIIIDECTDDTYMQSRENGAAGIYASCIKSMTGAQPKPNVISSVSGVPSGKLNITWEPSAGNMQLKIWRSSASIGDDIPTYYRVRIMAPTKLSFV